MQVKFHIHGCLQAEAVPFKGVVIIKNEANDRGYLLDGDDIIRCVLSCPPKCPLRHTCCTQKYDFHNTLK